MKEYTYNWYDGGISEDKKKAVKKALDEKDFEAFVDLYSELNSEAYKKKIWSDEFQSYYFLLPLPNSISVYDTETEDFEDDLNILCKDDFMKITFSESEAG